MRYSKKQLKEMAVILQDKKNTDTTPSGGTGGAWHYGLFLQMTAAISGTSIEHVEKMIEEYANYED